MLEIYEKFMKMAKKASKKFIKKNVYQNLWQKALKVMKTHRNEKKIRINWRNFQKNGRKLMKIYEKALKNVKN